MTRAGPGGCCTRLSRSRGLSMGRKRETTVELPMYVLLWPALPARVHNGQSCFLFPSLGSFWLVSLNPGIPEVSSLCLDRHDMALIRCGIESLGMSLVGIS